MAPAAAAAADRRNALLGRYCGVPTDFFDVSTDGGRFLATVTAKHSSRPEYVWLTFDTDGEEVYAPIDTVRKWLISDAMRGRE